MTAVQLSVSNFVTAPSDSVGSVHPAQNNNINQIDTTKSADFSEMLTNALSQHLSSGGKTLQLIDQQEPGDGGHDLPPGGNISPLSISISLNGNSPEITAPGNLIGVDGIQQPDATTAGSVSNNESTPPVNEFAKNPQLMDSLARDFHNDIVISDKQLRVNNRQIGDVSGQRATLAVDNNDVIKDAIVDDRYIPGSAPQPVSTISNTNEQALHQLLMSRDVDKFPGKDTGNNLHLDTLKPESVNTTGLSTSPGSGSHDNRSINHFTLPQPVSNPQWSHDFNDRVRWMIGNQVHKAELTLHPKSMGAIEISISIQNDQTSIHIVAQNAMAKDAVDNSIARLREMMDNAGINLADVDVSQHSGHDSAASEKDTPYYATESYSQLEDPAAAVQMSQQLIPENYSLIDFYA